MRKLCSHEAHSPPPEPWRPLPGAPENSWNLLQPCPSPFQVFQKVPGHGQRGPKLPRSWNVLETLETPGGTLPKPLPEPSRKFRDQRGPKGAGLRNLSENGSPLRPNAIQWLKKNFTFDPFCAIHVAGNAPRTPWKL